MKKAETLLANKDENGDKLPFNKFYIAEENQAKVNTANVKPFLKNLGLTPISETTNEEKRISDMAKEREIRNSTAEFLTFMAKGKEDGILALYKNEIV